MASCQSSIQCWRAYQAAGSTAGRPGKRTEVGLPGTCCKTAITVHPSECVPAWLMFSIRERLSVDVHECMIAKSVKHMDYNGIDYPVCNT